MFFESIAKSFKINLYLEDFKINFRTLKTIHIHDKYFECKATYNITTKNYNNGFHKAQLICLNSALFFEEQFLIRSMAPAKGNATNCLSKKKASLFND